MLNRAMLIGNLGQDPEVKSLPSGERVANLSVATTNKWKDQRTGEMKEATEWHRVEFWGKTAEIAAEYCHKGDRVYVEGSIRYRKYTDKQGIEKTATDIKGERLQLLGGRPRDDQSSQGAPNVARAPARAPASVPKGGAAGFDPFDGDIPFASSAFTHDATTSKARKLRGYDY